jgi:Kef-type K+ transport system membrane component KefB
VLALSSAGHGDQILFDLFIIFAAAKVAAELFERLKQPAVVGEILAGILIGPGVLDWVKPSELTHALSEIGVILLLFTVGLEVNPGALLKVGKRAFLVAVAGVVLPFFAGWGFMALWGDSTVEGIFIGAALVATSVGITARVLAGMNRLSTEASQVILAAAVIDDILGLLVLSVVSSLAEGMVNYREIFITALVVTSFTLFMVFVVARFVKKSRPAIERLRVGHAYFVVGLLLCFGLSLVAIIAGVAAIIGAFLAGMAMAEVGEDTELPRYAGGVTEFLVPFFLVGIGLQFDLKVFQNSSVVWLAVIVTVLAVLSKLIGCGAAALPMGMKNAARIGIGMVPRGEVGIIVAQLGLSLGVLSNALYGVVVFMAVATTLIAPPFLKILFREEGISSSAEGGVVGRPLSELE